MTGPPNDPEDAEPLAGTWWDGGDMAIREMLRELRATKEWLAELTVRLDLSPGARKSSTKGETPSTVHAHIMRLAMQRAGLPPEMIKKIFNYYFAIVRPQSTPDAARKATERVMKPAPKPAKKAGSKRNPKDK
jgi:hypothetical protein